MPFIAGDRLGPYVIVSPLGAGGMGAVYRARDPRLDRDVAIKVLHPDMLADADRRLRFVNEAKAASALSHPNIVTVHDIGVAGDVTYMVMELVDGQPLDRLIPATGLRLSEALRIGAQIADACARAHAAGIVHRDLKPANIMVQPDGRVRVLDFGIAKLVEGAQVGAVDATRTTADTTPGMVVGTAAYMSPEQAESRPVDGRSDIFSLGAVLYEMVTGQRAFVGDSPLSVMASVLQQDPKPPGAIRGDLPADLARVMVRCLRKDPARRAQSMADVRVALDDLRDELDSGALTAAPPSRRSSTRIRRLTVALVAVSLLATALAGVLWWRNGGPAAATAAAATPQVRPVTSYPGIETMPSFSPDGSQVAFVWDGPARDNLDVYVALVSGGTPLRLTTDALPDVQPAWSPDGRFIAFLRRSADDTIALVLVPPLGGPERRVGEFVTARGIGNTTIAALCWSADSRSLFVTAAEQRGQSNRLFRVVAESGETKALAALDAPDLNYASPALSPDGRTLAMVRYQTGTVDLLSLSEDGSAGAIRSLSAGNFAMVAAAWTPDGQALIVASGEAQLFRVPIDGGAVSRLDWTGPGASTPELRPGQMAFARAFRDVNIIRIGIEAARTASPVLERIAPSSFREVAPVYSPDGTRVAFYSNQDGSTQIWTARADGSQPAKLTNMDPLATTGAPHWSPDGRQIAFDSNAGGGYNIYVIGADGGRPRALTSGTGNFGGTWSRDGRWVYFTSNRSGRDQVWRVASGGGDAEQITRGGGSAAMESADGQWLYFVLTDGIDGLWRMPISGGSAVRMTEPIHRRNYALQPHGVYYVTRNPKPVIRFLDFASNTVRDVFAVGSPVDLGLAISPDGKYLLFAQEDYVGQDLMLAENFN